MLIATYYNVVVSICFYFTGFDCVKVDLASKAICFNIMRDIV